MRGRPGRLLPRLEEAQPARPLVRAPLESPPVGPVGRRVQEALE